MLAIEAACFPDDPPVPEACARDAGRGFVAAPRHMPLLVHAVLPAMARSNLVGNPPPPKLLTLVFVVVRSYILSKHVFVLVCAMAGQPPATDQRA